MVPLSMYFTGRPGEGRALPGPGQEDLGPAPRIWPNATRSSRSRGPCRTTRRAVAAPGGSSRPRTAPRSMRMLRVNAAILACDARSADAVAVRGVPRRRLRVAAGLLASLDPAGLHRPRRTTRDGADCRSWTSSTAGSPARPASSSSVPRAWRLRATIRVQHERSRFVREHGRWYYLDAAEPTASSSPS